MKRILSLTAAALVLGAFTSPAVAQHGNPVYVGGGGMGITLAGDFGYGINDASGKNKYVGGRAVIGASMLSVNVGAGYGLDTKAVTFGANGAINFLDMAGSPVAIGVYAGANVTTKGGTLITIPAGLVLTVSPPTGMVEFWFAPGLRHNRVSGGFNSTKFGGSAGLNVSMLHVALDYTNISGASPFLIGAGLHFAVGS